MELISNLKNFFLVGKIASRATIFIFAVAVYEFSPFHFSYHGLVH